MRQRMPPFPVTSLDRRVNEHREPIRDRETDMTVIAASTTSATSRTVSTRVLLGCAAVAAPLWATVSLLQAATREGFDLTRHPLSALSNGSLGWLQITNFLVAGLLTIIGAAGLRRVMRG